MGTPLAYLLYSIIGNTKQLVYQANPALSTHFGSKLTAKPLRSKVQRKEDL
jgi:hypothetical protein